MLAEGGHDARRSNEAPTRAGYFLCRSLYRRLWDGSVINPAFVQLHYPCYWHYDILFALTVFSETGQIKDERCSDALDLLPNKRLSDGGFPAEHCYYRHTRAMVPSQRSLVDWGGVSRRRFNPWVSVRGAVVLHAAGRRLESPADIPGTSGLHRVSQRS